MTPAARLAAAIEVFERSKANAGRPPTRSRLGAWRIALPAPATAPAIAGLVYDALRRAASSAFLMGAETPRAILLGMLKRERGLDTDAIAQACRRRRYAPAALERRRARAARRPRLDGAPAHVAAIIRNGSSRTSPRLRRRARGGGRGAGLARAARSAGQHAESASAMQAPRRLSDLAPEPTPLVALGPAHPLAADAKSPAIHAEPAFLKGMIEVQDEGSQLAALFAGAKPGEQVVDLCAGAGGKTLALAAMMENKGQIFATDDDKRRLAPIHDRLARAGARNVQVRTPKSVGDETRRSRRPHRSGADRRALHRHRRMAAQSGRQMADAARRAGAAAEGTGRSARPRRAAAQSRRPHRLCHLLGAGRGERRAGARVPRAPSGILGLPPAEVTSALGERAAMFAKAARLSDEGCTDDPAHRPTPMVSSSAC